MKILWLSPFLLHPARQGGQIRSLGILSQLNQRHEVRFVSMHFAEQASGLERVKEYCGTSRLIAHAMPARGTAGFYWQMGANLFSRLPLTIQRDVSAPFRKAAEEELARGWHDVVVCDFLSLAVNLERIHEVVIFQHNVETVIWDRMAESTSNPLTKVYLRGQANRMAHFEGHACRSARHVIAVSGTDEEVMRKRFGVTRVSAIPTGVDLQATYPNPIHPPGAEFVFIGSLNWMANLDGLNWFASEIWPRIRQKQPGARLVLVGRHPGPDVQRIAQPDSGITIHADVPDVLPYLWGAKAAIVPLRVGGGTRIKIYEAMAAGVPQVSTTVGAEGLKVVSGENILLADDPESFASCCLQMVEDEQARQRIRNTALAMVQAEFGLPKVADAFESILMQCRERR